MTKVFDFLVIGSGVAGLSYALKVAEHGKVCIVTKSLIDETNTSYAQGGIAAVTHLTDNYEKHVKDTMIAGAGLNYPDVVKMVVHEAPEQINQLVKWGAVFDKNPDGDYDLAKEGGHTENRILHYKDSTGAEIQRVLVLKAREHRNITILEHHFAVELITQHYLGRLIKRYYTDIECYGAYVYDLKKEKTIKFVSKVTLIATGGCGNLYQTTTNPSIATGDGISMVYRAKGIIDFMEFMQFHPTSLYNPGESPAFLITEAMRGFGAILKTQDGKEFMQKYDARGSLAPRDIVARAIDNEMKTRGDDFVYLDCRHISENDLEKHFPNINAKCKSLGINLLKDMIPVVPAAHYICGGIKVDKNGLSTIQRLYAAGEVSFTGLHGGNRLASNSLLEALVYADKAAKHSIEHYNSFDIPENIPEWNDEGTTHPEEMVLITQNYKEMQTIMTNYVGIVRSNLRLERALVRLEIIFRETETLYRKSTLSRKLCELRNLITVGYLIIKCAQQRRESIGLHYNIDFPPKKTNLSPEEL